MNLYATPAQALAVNPALTETALMLVLLERASRDIDNFCGRHFFSETAIRYFVPRWPDVLAVDDLLSVTEIATDDDRDTSLTFEAVWTSGEYELWPFNKFPKLQIRRLAQASPNYSFQTCRKSARVTGIWGYGDGLSATPWAASGITGTVANGTLTTLTASAGGLVAGQTILIGTEQMQITAADGPSLTVVRGINGTTAAAQSAAAISTAKYPPPVTHCAIVLATRYHDDIGMGDKSSERIGDYSYSRQAGVHVRDEDFMVRMIGPYRRLEFS